MIARTTARRQRARPRPDERTAERYRAIARQAQRGRGRGRRFTYVAWPLMLVLGFVITVRAASELGASVDSLSRDLAASVATVFPSAPPQTLEVDRPIGAAALPDPLLDSIPSFTNASQWLLQGRIPAIALGTDRRVEISLNGKVIGTVPIDNAGRFAQPLTLAEGANDIVATLVKGADAISSTSANVIFDKTPPALTLVRPKAGDTIADGSAVAVEGKSEPNAVVLVNGRQVLSGPDGSFSETFTASPGPLTIAVVSRDQAGNETKTQVAVTVKDKAPAVVGMSIVVNLDRTKVRPGETVVADINVLEGGRLKPDVTVTLNVGVITIGSAKTNAIGNAKIGFAAPTTEGDIAVVILGGDAAGRATLTVAR